jgi:hypothetical protein
MSVAWEIQIRRVLQDVAYERFGPGWWVRETVTNEGRRFHLCYFAETRHYLASNLVGARTAMFQLSPTAYRGDVEALAERLFGHLVSRHSAS